MIPLWTALAVIGLLLTLGAQIALLVHAVRARGAVALLAIVVPPLALWWGWEDARHRLCGAWVAGFVLYALVSIAA